MFNVQANNQRLYSINTSELSPGIYFISIETEAGTTNKKIIIAE
jgi:hypothetical protein